MGSEIGTENYEFLTVFLTYVKGDETGVDVILNLRHSKGGTDHPNRIWASSSGVQTSNVEKIRLAASGSYAFTWDIGGVDFVSFTQGGSNNDGTPTGTLAADYTLT
jgi:hypothetical protein